MKLYVVGTGPGNSDHISGRAREVIEKADCIAGYTTYIELINDLVKGKKLISTGMMKEIDRVEQGGGWLLLTGFLIPGLHFRGGFSGCRGRAVVRGRGTFLSVHRLSIHTWTVSDASDSRILSRAARAPLETGRAPALRWCYA